MEKATNLSLWTESGYDLFAHEGPEGVQVERLATILDLDKSGFYDLFGDLDGYFDELLKLHKKKADVFLDVARKAKSLDPDYLLALLDHKVLVIFHRQLTRIKNPKFLKVAELIDRERDVIIRPLWSNYLGTESNPDLALKYYNIIRDVFYERVSFQNFTYPFLQNLVEEAKAVIKELTRRESEKESFC